MSRISWGVDGFGTKSYFCNYCELVFGEIDPVEIKHDCDKSKPRYHNRDKFHNNQGITDGAVIDYGTKKPKGKS
ncbi:MAG: hypothetical protein GY799_06360 [Desulfobulbaceae bacterium]|nr:hypothetical protein [Desulfobulbaceae bacterium]